MQTSKAFGTVLDACVIAFAAFLDHDMPETRLALAGARVRFREAAEAEFGVSQKDLTAAVCPRAVESDVIKDDCKVARLAPKNKSEPAVIQNQKEDGNVPTAQP